MKNTKSMRRIFFGWVFLVGTVFFLTVPEISSAAAFVPCGRVSGTADEMAPCTLCHIIVGGKVVMDWGLRVMTAIGLAVITAMGIWYIVSAGNPGMINQAKSGIKTTLIGVAVMLGAWLIVNTVLLLFAQETDPAKNPIVGLRSTGKFNFTCSTESLAGTGTTDGTGGSVGSGVGATGGGVASTGGVGAGGAGSCKPVTSGACSVENMKACSRWNPEAASGICMKESSGGNTLAVSVTDKCADGSSFSFGLFQLNIIANGGMFGADCDGTSVFSAANGSTLKNPGNNGGCLRKTTNSKGVSYCSQWDCKVKDTAKYEECKKRAFDVSKNVEAGCTLYGRTGWKPWPVTRKLCGL